jgi:hypothetical protein
MGSPEAGFRSAISPFLGGLPAPAPSERQRRSPQAPAPGPQSAMADWVAVGGPTPTK